MERFIHWFHHHDEQESVHEHDKGGKTTVPLIIISDTLHNFLDGMVIAATFMTSIPLGIVTTIAIAAHEIPQEIGDFGLLLHKGVKSHKIIIINLVSAAFAFAGAFIMYFLGETATRYTPMFLAVTAGFFIYIATSDLIPEIHYEKRKGFAVIETGLLLVGVLVIWLAVESLGH
jgi:zinc and cadmium transporter